MMRQAWQAILVAMVWWQGMVSLHADTPRDSLVGKWQHTSDKVRLIIEDKRFHFTYESKGHPPVDGFSLHADYSTTHDQTLFAVITRVEAANESVREHHGLVLLDEPICFRFRVEDGVLVLHDMKNVKNDQTRKLLEGVYKPAVPITNRKPATKQDEDFPRRDDLPTPVPACTLFGNRLENFSLRDHEDKVWEYKRDRRGRLTLLDFWYHNCAPCLQSIPYLVKLQRDFEPYGLEVVSIACETGSVGEQRRQVKAVRGRFGINYRTLLSDGGAGHCPVMEQFQVDFFPLLVLTDADGTILWRSTREGMDDREYYKLTKTISDRLLRRAP